MITNIAHLCFVVPDLERTLAFYRDRLGMTLAFEFQNAGGERTGFYLHAGGRNFLEFFKGAVEGPARGPYAHVSLEVDDIQMTVTALRSAQVEVSDPVLGCDGAWQAWLSDPDGNRIELHEYTADSSQQLALSGKTVAPLKI